MEDAFWQSGRVSRRFKQYFFQKYLNGARRSGRYYQKKLSTADISAFLQLIGKLSLSEKIDLGIIEKLSLSKMCS